MMWDEIVEELFSGAKDSESVERLKQWATMTPCFEITNIYQWAKEYEKDHDRPKGADYKSPSGSWFVEFKTDSGGRFGIFAGVYPLIPEMEKIFAECETGPDDREDPNVVELLESMTMAAGDKAGRDEFKQLIDSGQYCYRLDAFLKKPGVGLAQLKFFVFADKELKHRVTYSPMDMAKRKQTTLGAEVTMDMILYFLMFISTKNITVQSFRIPSDKLNKRREERGKPPLSIYKVLTIDPSKVSREFLPRMTDRGMEGLRYHFCRGHIKSYTEDAPLFGKFSGTWFWSPTMRGKKSAGEVHKTYRVEIDGKGGGDGGEKESRDSSDG